MAEDTARPTGQETFDSLVRRVSAHPIAEAEKALDKRLAPIGKRLTALDEKIDKLEDALDELPTAEEVEDSAAEGLKAITTSIEDLRSRLAALVHDTVVPAVQRTPREFADAIADVVADAETRIRADVVDLHRTVHAHRVESGQLKGLTGRRLEDLRAAHDAVRADQVSLTAALTGIEGRLTTLAHTLTLLCLITALLGAAVVLMWVLRT